MQGTNAVEVPLIKDLRIIALELIWREFLKVEGHRDLVRDTRTGAILNKNKTAYIIIKKDYKKHKDKEMK